MASFTKFAGLEGAVVLVTGGATGIGSAIVETFVGQGSLVLFLDIDAAASAAQYPKSRLYFIIPRRPLFTLPPPPQ